MRIDEISVFVKVFEAGSFAAAARALGMPKATVSAKMAALEQRLGVTLIQRTTRSLRPTPAGVIYFERCRRGLAEIEAAEAALAAEAEEPVGVLRITVPVVYGEELLPSLLGGFLERYPAVRADAVVTNRELDLVAEGVDLALRIGRLKDSSYVARHFISDGSSFYASDSYIKRHGEPETLEDLAGHRVVGLGRGRLLQLTRGSEPVEVTVDPTIASDDFHMTRSLIEMGAGIGYLPDIMVRGSRRPVRPRRVLPDYRRRGATSFVYPNQAFVPTRVRRFIAYALEHASEWGA